MSSTTESVGIVAGKTAAYGGGATAFVSGLTLSEVGVIVGIVVAVLGLLLGQFWSWRRDRREQREMDVRLSHDIGTGWDKL
ncbi:hypothetical protein H9K76_18390 [Diaphorobacter ruginosibacter]|uniref:Holin n=1 Tax=Diaphorobacter ruginosibacter TaxID=1715720 RepID=A0A7G9RLL1_9BURK|nr:holin [Diaphorobacter ruginosibacter]QNN56486.1 hypothetical protein H9K76_18390 [Diaphorobacter ruginosibacter]